MKKCIACGEDGIFHIRALEVRTLPIRGMEGVRRVQALGAFTDAAVCAACAKATLEKEKSVFSSARTRIAAFGCIFLAGILLEWFTFAQLSGERVFILLGAAAILCGILGTIQALRESVEKKKEIEILSEKEALQAAAWDVFVKVAPQKDGDQDITYIPVTEQTLKRKNGDLAILYHLLSDIAKEAYIKLHQENVSNQKE